MAMSRGSVPHTIWWAYSIFCIKVLIKSTMWGRWFLRTSRKLSIWSTLTCWLKNLFISESEDPSSLGCVTFSATVCSVLDTILLFLILQLYLPVYHKAILGPIGFQVIINDAVQNNSGPISCWKYVDDLTIAETAHILIQASYRLFLIHSANGLKIIVWVWILQNVKPPDMLQNWCSSPYWVEN